MQWLRKAIVAVLCAVGLLTASPHVAQGQVFGGLAGLWAWRNIVAPEVGGPWIAPDTRFRPFGLLDGDNYWGPVVTNGQAVIVVNVPDPDARVWLQGQLMQSNGRQRVFLTPPLEPGANYSYEIRAQGGIGAQAFDQTRTVPIRLGQQVMVDFWQAAPNVMPFAR